MFRGSTPSSTLATANQTAQMSMESRAFDTTRLGAGYGFVSHPKLAVQLPPTWALIAGLGFLVSALCFWGYIVLFFLAPTPRLPRRSEKQYITILPDGSKSAPQELPCWLDKWAAAKKAAKKQAEKKPGTKVVVPPQVAVEEAELFMSVVVPAYNEEERLEGMLEEAVEVLESEYGRTSQSGKGQQKQKGWEILIVSDGSSDGTVAKALKFAKEHQLSQHPVPKPGPWSKNGNAKALNSTTIPHGSIRVITLEENRGKGGAVTHGMRHVRGQYVVFADADGASRFSDLPKLVSGCQTIEDEQGRGVAIGSRAHLVGSEAVVQRSALRNFLMHSFHILLRIMTPPATARIKDTQCGFKLFSRPALPYIIPYMHSEGWIFDVEMLMLAESAEVAMIEVAIGWKEVLGSKLNVVWDSIGMAWGLALLRVCWILGIYRRD